MTVTDETINTVAGALYDAYRSSTPCDPIAEQLTGGGIAAAYAAQEVNTRRWLAEGRRLVGRKIGLTSPAVQRQLGVGQPDYGMLFADMAVDEGADVALGRLLQPRAEAEIAFVLGRDLPNPDATVAEVMQAIDFAVAAIEIVDSRIAGWKIGILDTVADNASSGLYVLGSRPVRLDQFDPLACGMVMERRRRTGFHRCRPGLPRESDQRRGVARAHHGSGGSAAHGRRHHLERRARDRWLPSPPVMCSKPASRGSARSRPLSQLPEEEEPL